MQSLRRLCIVLLLSLAVCASASAQTAPKQGILLVAFGSSMAEAGAAFAAIDEAYQREFPHTPIVWAFTSQIIRKKLAKEGIHVASISEGLNILAADGAKIVRVQSLHMMAGKEFAGLARALLVNIQKHPGRFDAVYLGRPLLESETDAEETANAVLNYLKKIRQPDEAIALMGHGQEHGLADLIFAGARSIFKSKDKNIFMATVEGSHGFDRLARELIDAKVRKVILAPLMLVAGDHARNDMAGTEPDSWANRLQQAGIAARANLQGLGEIPGIAAIFARHTRESEDDLTKEPVKE